MRTELLAFLAGQHLVLAREVLADDLVDELAAVPWVRRAGSGRTLGWFSLREVLVAST
jgi:hypothetical protein